MNKSEDHHHEAASIAHAIATVGPDTAQEQWLDRVAGGQKHLATAVTEPQVGHNVFRSQTTVQRDGDRLLVNGMMGVTSGIEIAERILTLGRVPGGREPGTPPQFTAILIDPKAPGLTREELPMRGREGVRRWQVQLKDVEAPLDAVVGTEGQSCSCCGPCRFVQPLQPDRATRGRSRESRSSHIDSGS